MTGGKRRGVGRAFRWDTEELGSRQRGSEEGRWFYLIRLSVHLPRLSACRIVRPCVRALRLSATPDKNADPSGWKSAARTPVASGPAADGGLAVVHPQLRRKG